MIAVLAHHIDGSCHKLFSVSKEFDLQSWANAKSSYLRYLNICQLEVVDLDAKSS